jgi:hypothetical protein
MRVRHVLVAAAAAALLTASPASAATKKGPSTCNGAKALCARTFDQVVLPGSHNAMSAESLGWKIPNQQVPMPAQLQYGVRALLFDTHYGRKQADGQVLTDDDGSVTTGTRGTYFCHEFCQIGATPLVAGLKGITTWLKKHPDNVLAIVNEDYVTPKDFAKAMKQSGLERFVYRGKAGPKWPTLAKMIATRQQVVVLAEHKAKGVPWYHLAYEGIVQETGYSWATPDLLTVPANWPASCAPNRGGTKGSLFLMNHWSPPTPPMVPDPVASGAVNAKDVLVGRAEACRTVRGRLPSIVAVDQAKIGGLIAAVKQLNGV